MGSESNADLDAFGTFANTLGFADLLSPDVGRWEAELRDTVPDLVSPIGQSGLPGANMARGALVPTINIWGQFLAHGAQGEIWLGMGAMAVGALYEQSDADQATDMSLAGKAFDGEPVTAEAQEPQDCTDAPEVELPEAEDIDLSGQETLSTGDVPQPEGILREEAEMKLELRQELLKDGTDRYVDTSDGVTIAELNAANATVESGYDEPITEAEWAALNESNPQSLIYDANAIDFNSQIETNYSEYWQGRYEGTVSTEPAVTVTPTVSGTGPTAGVSVTSAPTSTSRGTSQQTTEQVESSTTSTATADDGSGSAPTTEPAASAPADTADDSSGSTDGGTSSDQTNPTPAGSGG